MGTAYQEYSNFKEQKVEGVLIKKKDIKDTILALTVTSKVEHDAIIGNKKKEEERVKYFFKDEDEDEFKEFLTTTVKEYVNE